MTEQLSAIHLKVVFHISQLCILFATVSHKYISDIAQQFVHFILVFTTDAFAKRNLNPFKMILQIAVNVH